MIEESLGESLRALREQHRVTLRALAAQTGFSPSFLSQIENGQCSPSLSSMEKIANALGVTLGQFFRVAESPKANVVRSTDRLHLALEWSRADLEALAFLGDGSQFQAVLVSIKPGGLSGKHSSPSKNHEFAFIYEGQTILTLQESDIPLQRGDSVTIPAGLERRWRNESDQITQILLVSVTVS
ncbi:MAG TPA: helix-turn-helix domain-containing protein [Bryobacteraceae bacterium]|nr:helix-turn-helix domain-containing protein [Bryobacteraceae bacterium]